MSRGPESTFDPVTKEATRALDAIAARRRRLPMVKFENKYEFDGPDGKKTLLDLFDGQVQLAVYQFMDNGPDEFCPGRTHFTENVSDLGTLARVTPRTSYPPGSCQYRRSPRPSPSAGRLRRRDHR